MSDKERLENRILEYLRSVGYRGMGTMSRDLDVSLDRVKWTLQSLVKAGKVETDIYGGIRVYRAKTQGFLIEPNTS